MTRAEKAMRSERIVPTLRGDYSWADLELIVSLLSAHGLSLLEYTLTGKNALEAIARLKEEHGSRLLVGAGTVRNAADLREAVARGADFAVAPHFTPELAEAADAAGLLLVPGVFTPTEAEAAFRAGFSLQKLFPAASGGPAHLKALLGPYPHLSFVPTGGVSVGNAAEYFRAGATAVGIGTGLFAPGAARETLDAGLRQLVAAAGNGAGA